MSSEKSLTPQIRFKGFTEAWEQRKVGELLIERNEQAPMCIEYPLMAFIANKGVAPKGERYDRSSLITDIKNKLYKRTEFGDFIYSSNNLETGSIGLNEYGKACISPVYSIFQPTEISDSSFLGRRLVRKDFINLMVKWRQGVIYGQWRIHESDFLKIEIFIPLIKEQRKIGKFLTQLDNLITLHQRKLDALKKIKSALLEKMFPKDDSDIPEIRFTGFTEAWEQRKAIDLFKDVSEKGFDNLPVLSATQDRGMVYRDENGINISHDKKNELTYKHVIPGQFVIHLRSFQGGFAHSAIEGITSPAYTVFKFSNASQHDDIFWKYIFMSERFIKSLESVTYGIRDGRSISYSEFLGLPFAVPEKEEESCIGYFLKKYDSLITLHQRKLDALKKIKSALLEKMFV